MWASTSTGAEQRSIGAGTFTRTRSALTLLPNSSTGTSTCFQTFPTLLVLAKKRKGITVSLYKGHGS